MSLTKRDDAIIRAIARATRKRFDALKAETIEPLQRQIVALEKRLAEYETRTVPTAEEIGERLRKELL